MSDLADRLERGVDLIAGGLSGLKAEEIKVMVELRDIFREAITALRADARDAERLEWLWRMLPGALLRTMFGELSNTGDMKIARAAIDAAMEVK